MSYRQVPIPSAPNSMLTYSARQSPDPKTVHRSACNTAHPHPSSIEIAKPSDPNSQRAFFFNKAPASDTSFSLCNSSLQPLSLTCGRERVAVQLGVGARSAGRLAGCAQLVREPKPRTGPERGFALSCDIASVSRLALKRLCKGAWEKLHVNCLFGRGFCLQAARRCPWCCLVLVPVPVFDADLAACGLHK